MLEEKNLKCFPLIVENSINDDNKIVSTVRQTIMQQSKIYNLLQGFLSYYFRFFGCIESSRIKAFLDERRPSKWNNKRDFRRDDIPDSKYDKQYPLKYKFFVIEESMIETADPWYAFISPWKLITYFYPLLHYIIRQNDI
jgi:hypothetical protein